MNSMLSGPSRRTRVRGFTLVEIMVAIAIIGVGIAGVLYYQSRAEVSQQAADATKTITAMASKIKAYYKPTNTYAQVTAANLNKMNLVADPLSWNGTNALDPWNNTMTIAGGTTTFILSIGGSTTSLDKEACTAVATSLKDVATVIRVGGTTTPVTLNTSGGTAGTVTGGNLFKGGTTTGDLTALATGCSDTNPVIGLQFQ